MNSSWSTRGCSVYLLLFSLFFSPIEPGRRVVIKIETVFIRVCVCVIRYLDVATNIDRLGLQLAAAGGGARRPLRRRGRRGRGRRQQQGFP